MSILRQPIERKLSAVVGAEVSFEKLKLSLLGGSLEASGVIIAGDDPDAPLLTIKRVRAEISVAKALAKQFVIKSLTIESPVISIILRRDGATNLPRRAPQEEIATVTVPATEESEPEEHEEVSEEQPASWRLETQKVSLIDGQIQFRDETGGSAYFASAEQITADLHQDEDQVTVVLNAGSVGRRDRPISLGTIHLEGKFSDITDLANLAKAPLEAKLELAGGIVAELSLPSMESGEVAVNLQGPLDLAEWVSSLPPSLPLPGAFTVPGFAGRANISLKLRRDPADGIVVDEFTLRASQIKIPPVPSR